MNSQRTPLDEFYEWLETSPVSDLFLSQVVEEEECVVEFYAFRIPKEVE